MVTVACGSSHWLGSVPTMLRDKLPKRLLANLPRIPRVLLPDADTTGPLSLLGDDNTTSGVFKNLEGIFSRCMDLPPADDTGPTQEAEPPGWNIDVEEFELDTNLGISPCSCSKKCTEKLSKNDKK